jgi:hypothetical protein
VVMVGSYSRPPPNHQSNVTPPNWANYALGKRKCTISPMQINKSINNSNIKSIIKSILSSINHSAMQINFQSILPTFKFMKWHEAAEHWVNSSICFGVRRKQDEDSLRRIRTLEQWISKKKIRLDKQQ